VKLLNDSQLRTEIFEISMIFVDENESNNSQLRRFEVANEKIIFGIAALATTS